MITINDWIYFTASIQVSTMCRNFIIFACVLLAISATAADSLLSNGVDNLPKADNYLFENDIRNFLEKIRGILKNGDPEQGIPPMEPLPIPHYDFHFLIDESRLTGYIDKILAYNVSDFIVTRVNFNPFGITLNLGLRFENLTLVGNYQLEGNIFEEAANGEGTFKSVTKTLDVSVFVHFDSNLDRSQISELTVFFTFENDDIRFTNTVNGETAGHMDNAYLEPLLYRIRDEYFPELENTLKLVGSDFLYETTLEQILQVILDIIQGKGIELIKTDLSRNL